MLIALLAAERVLQDRVIRRWYQAVIIMNPLRDIAKDIMKPCVIFGETFYRCNSGVTIHIIGNIEAGLSIGRLIGNIPRVFRNDRASA